MRHISIAFERTLTQSFSEPAPLPWRQLAARLFDNAFTEIAAKKAL